MIYRLSDKSVKDLSKLPKNSINKFKNFINTVTLATNSTEINNIVKLKGFENAYRKRIGNYRIGFFIENNEVLIARILKRDDIYKNFP